MKEKLKAILAILRGENWYSEQQLVSFGNYLLSDERNNRLVKEIAKQHVGDWDLENWKEYGPKMHRKQNM